MARTDLKVVSVNDGAKITTSVPYINEGLSSATLVTMAQMLNAFTTNNYTEANRVNTINVDTEEVPVSGGGSSEDPNLTKGTFKKNGIILNFEGNGTPRIFMIRKTATPQADGYGVELTLSPMGEPVGTKHTYQQSGADWMFDDYGGEDNITVIVLLSASGNYSQAWLVFDY